MEKSDDEGEMEMERMEEANEEEEEEEEEIAEEEKEVVEGVVYYGELKCQARRGSGKACTNNAYFAQPKIPSGGLASFLTAKHRNNIKMNSNKKNKKTNKNTQNQEKKNNNSTKTDNHNKEEEEEGDEVVVEERFLCGVHAKDKLGRRPLPKRDPKDRKRIEQQRNEADRAAVEQHRQRNQAAGRRGDVVLERLRMLKAPRHREGYLRVYPNFKHQNKADGFGCARLSPMSLGPVDHGQPDLPPALNIENFHQGTKVFKEEIDAEGNPGPRYVANRLRFYEDPVPHRHKYRASGGGNRNIPLYFLWIDRRYGSEHRLTYVESRQFYCNFYERLASQEPDFQKLVEMVEAGTNLQLCGYDAHPLPEGQTIEGAYLDPSVPFGHERVLYAMLLLHDRPDDFPWRKHKTFDF
ncbi:uncharacterized protein ACA1_183540 [Acanthamoeba castellanii str. Neff]|uniref:Uncharacterized protein n=1 Tax=Acanthamoeba castellanii (strain ATCC 30010 / Neff) TaxID=1257118 RepID=L8H799_ACACF|nr:uncharacterized protein ACA1_183540 [Acanthamoeba castellanii str. Neff]ELR21419.1 hypothetical protein ACA1_183540 [Acanthamoeba castellanii str. Neff]